MVIVNLYNSTNKFVVGKQEKYRIEVLILTFMLLELKSD